MKTSHSPSLLLVWALAELEARELGASVLQPIHFLLGLCKSVEVDAFDIVTRDHPDRGTLMEECLREIRRIRLVFERAGIDPRHEGRGVRISLVGNLLGSGSSGTRIRRDANARAAFSNAEKLATLEGEPVYPIHLMYALVEMRIEAWERQIESNGKDPHSLKKVLDQEVQSLNSRVNDSTSNSTKTDPRNWGRN